MAYYIVVHHQRDEHQPWSNDWVDDDRLKTITTTPEIASRCALAKDHGERVYVHRCGWHESPPRICCSVAVSDARASGGLGLVEFHDARFVGATPRYQPGRGQNSYEADPPDSGSD